MAIWVHLREFQKNIYFCFIDYAKAFDCVDHNKLENFSRDGTTGPPNLPLEKPMCRSGSNSKNIKKQRHYFDNKVRLVKAMVFPVVMYGCESWTVKKAEH